jgi:tetratricopeptide (TPR) repeat protein
LRQIAKSCVAGFAALVLFGLVGAWVEAASAASIAAADFMASPAAEAFRRLDFEAALAGFQALLARYPDDPLILRYIGISNHRLGRYGAAREAFDAALAVDPDNLAVVFYRAITDYETGESDAAAAGFQRVVAGARGTDYANRAREFLAKLQPGNLSGERPGGARWDSFLQAGLQYDDNVDAAPDHDDSLRFTENATFEYKLVEEGGWRLRAGVTGFLSQHTKAQFESYDVQQFGGDLELSYATSIDGVPVIPALRYAYRRTLLDSGGFDSTHSATAQLDAAPFDGATTRLFYELDIAAFSADGARPSSTSRDGIIQHVGIKEFVELDGRDLMLTLGYAFALAEARGDNFDLRGHDVTLGLAIALPDDMRLDLSSGYGHKDYPDFDGPRERRTDRFRLGAALNIPIDDNLAVSLGFDQTFQDSNYSTLEFDRGIVTFMLGYRL